MTFPFPFGNKPEDSEGKKAEKPARRKRSPLLITIVILAALAVAVVFGAQVWTEVLWYQQMGFAGVFTTTWLTRIGLFIAGFLVMGFATWGSLKFAYSSRPIYAPTTPAQQALYQYQNAIEPLRRMLQIVLPVVLGLFAGGAVTNAWSTVLLFFRRSSFGTKDPEHHLDASFYIFTLPMLRGLVSFLMAVVFISVICAAVTQYLYGGLRFGGKGGFRITKAARGQLGLGAAAFTALVGVNYWLDRYSLLVADKPDMTGANYTDINALLPARTIMAGIALVVVILFVIAAIRGTWRLPVLGVGLMVVAAVVIGGIYPALVQQFRVKPNEQQLETPYIQRNIDATLKAYQIDDVETSAYSAKTEAEPGALRQDADATASIRLLDPTIVSPSFRQLQQNKQYYDFAPQLSVDRYTIKGESRDTVIGVRELNLDGVPRNWVNLHTVYTHGYGVVAAFGNTTGPEGEPAFYEGGIPAKGELGEFEPRIYFGEGTSTYAIVGAPEGRTAWELDYPDDSAPNGQKSYTYTGDGGPKIGSIVNRLLFAIRMGSSDILFSDRVTPESQILFDRNPALRVQKVAPYLTLDERVYPAVVDGRVVWMIDGYTSSDSFPYSQMTSFETATADSQNRQNQFQSIVTPNFNYIRNSVKATVDAYTGKVTLYAWDAEDPLLNAWQGIFPGTVKPMSDISADLMNHIRYPEDLFKIQRQLLTRYHVTDAASFYSAQAFWQTPNDPAKGNRTLQPPYYLTLRMPTQKAPTFSLTSSFIPRGQGTSTDRNVLTGFLSANAEAGNKAGQRDPDYGKLRLLQLPQGTTVPGPGQAENRFTSNTTVSSQLNLLRTGGGSTVTLGNLLTLPVGGGLLYVQPVYVQASQGTQYPLLKKVLVSFGETIGFADTLDAALDQVFGGDSGAKAGDATKPNTTPGGTAPPDGTDTGTGEPTPQPSPTGSAQPTTPTAPNLAEALERASKAMQDSDAAMRAGDWTAYGEAQQRLQKAIEDAMAAEGAPAGGASPTPTPTP